MTARDLVLCIEKLTLNLPTKTHAPTSFSYSNLIWLDWIGSAVVDLGLLRFHQLYRAVWWLCCYFWHECWHAIRYTTLCYAVCTVYTVYTVYAVYLKPCIPCRWQWALHKLQLRFALLCRTVSCLKYWLFLKGVSIWKCYTEHGQWIR